MDVQHDEPLHTLPDVVQLRFPSCDLKTLAALMRISRGSAQARYRDGALDHLVMRTIRGDEWRPAGRITFDALRVRDALDELSQARFDAWQMSGRLMADAA